MKRKNAFDVSRIRRAALARPDEGVWAYVFRLRRLGRGFWLAYGAVFWFRAFGARVSVTDVWAAGRFRTDGALSCDLRPSVGPVSMIYTGLLLWRLHAPASSINPRSFSYRSSA